LTTYPISEAVNKACRHAATIARLKFQDMERLMAPPPTSKTATVTFIKLNHKTHAVTARHVVETFDKLAQRDGEPFEGYQCVQGDGAALPSPFLTPPADYPFQKPDIAICPVRQDLPEKVGKIAFEIRPEDDPKWPVSHAIAIGYPTNEKHDTKDQVGATRLAMRCVHAIAEGMNSPGSSDQVQFLSELPERPAVGSLSGMSGGPVFWSDRTSQGLIGFVKEALDVTLTEGAAKLFDKPKVNFICQRADFAIFGRWAEFVNENWQKERDKINAAIKKSQMSSRG
jgi:hypothetical protein